jgi:hypothetical protein
MTTADTTNYVMTETVIDYNEQLGNDQLRGYVEVNVAAGDDCAEVHIEDVDGAADLRLTRVELEALIAAAQRAIDLLSE